MTIDRGSKKKKEEFNKKELSTITEEDFNPSLIKEKYLSPRTDPTFRRLCGKTENKEIAMSIINSLIELEAPVVDLEFPNPQNIPDIPDGKATVIDVFASDQKGRRFLLEMQLQHMSYFGHRALHYLSRSYVEQIGKGEDYDVLKKAYLIAFTEQVLFKDHTDYRSVHKLIETSSNRCLLDLLEMRFYEAPKFHKTEEELETVGDCILYLFMKWDYTTGHIPKAFKRHEVIMKAVHELDRVNWTEGDLLYYHVWKNRDKDWNAAIHYQKERAKEAAEEAREEGMERGLEQGLERGKEEIISALLSAGMSIKEISRITKIPVSDIKGMMH